MVDHRARHLFVRVLLSALLVGAASCSGADSDHAVTVATGLDDSVVPAEPADAALARSVRRAVEAVDTELGGPQRYFEVTATPQLTNVFVAIDDATAAVPFVFIDDALEGPGPTLDDVAGQTFGVDDLTFDDRLILSRIASELPSAAIVSLSVEGTAAGLPRYTVSASSSAGGVLDIVVGPTGEIVSVEPL